MNWIYTNSILKHDIEHSSFFVPAKLSEARRTGGTRERNEAKPGRKRCCANDMLSMRIRITYFRNRILLPISMLVKRNMQIPMDFGCFGMRANAADSPKKSAPPSHLEESAPCRRQSVQRLDFCDFKRLFTKSRL